MSKLPVRTPLYLEMGRVFFTIKSSYSFNGTTYSPPADRDTSDIVAVPLDMVHTSYYGRYWFKGVVW